MKLGGFLSKYLKASDFPIPALLTIERFDEEEMQDGASKLVVYFTERAPGVVLSKTTIAQFVEALGSEDPNDPDTDEWIGCAIVGYNDPSVMFQGKKTGGIRFRKSKKAVERVAVQPRQPARGNHTAPADQDDLPF
jgi:hypothetical protein